MAMLNSKWIADGKKILHFWNGVIHLTIAGIFALRYHWWHFFTILLIARVTFDTALNLFRFGWSGINYVPLDPKSIVDKMEKKLFGTDFYTPKLIYILLIVILLAL